MTTDSASPALRKRERVEGFFTGKPYDSDLKAYTFLFRDYHPEMARWAKPDPAGFPAMQNSGNGFQFTWIRCVRIRLFWWGIFVFLWLGNGAKLMGDGGPNVFLERYRLYHRVPREIQGPERIHGILVICPGLNGSGEAACGEGSPWAGFADRQRLLLVSPTFYCDSGKVHDRQVCYYYPESGSFEWLLKEIDVLAERYSVRDKCLLVFGFSAGAHVVHRLALWKHERVKAVAAQGAGWWDEPKMTGQRVPMLILCGEQDERYHVCLEFYRKAMRGGYPMAWRSYPGLGHGVDVRIIKLTQAFLGAYCMDSKNKSEWIGDIQEWQAYPAGSEDAEAIPLPYQAILPSAMTAEVWMESGCVP